MGKFTRLVGLLFRLIDVHLACWTFYFEMLLGIEHSIADEMIYGQSLLSLLT